MKLKSPASALESEKLKDIALKIRIKLPRKKMPKKNASSSSSSSTSSSTWNRCGECSMMFSSTKALYGHLRIHRKNNRGAKKSPFSTFRRAKHADVIAACVLMGIRRSKSEANIDDAKLSRLKWVCAKIERQMKMKMNEKTSNQSENYQSLICEMVAPSMMALGGQCAAQCEKSSSYEEVNAGAVVEMEPPSTLMEVGPLEVEIHQCDKCDKVFNSGQALGGHKRAHYTGPPLCRPRSNRKSQAAVMTAAAEVVAGGFYLNEPAEEVFL